MIFLQRLKKYLPVWELGFVLIGLSCVGFVLEVAQDIKPKSWSEYGLLAFIIFAAFAVGVFWTRKWYNFRHQLVSLDSKPLIPRKYVIGFVCFVFVLVLFSKFFHHYLESQPEFLSAQSTVKTNPAILVRFGSIKEIEMDDTGDEIGFSGNERTGAYQFRITGTSRNGVVRISWYDKNGAFIPTKIEEVGEEGAETMTTLWSKAGE